MPVVKLENKTARILHVSLGGGRNVAIPPTEGGIKVKMSDSEKESFDLNVATETVQEWIDSGDLIISEGEAEPPADDAEDDLDDEPADEDEA